MTSFTIFGTKVKLNDDVIWWIAVILFVIQVLRFGSKMLKNIWAPKPVESQDNEKEEEKPIIKSELNKKTE